MLIEALENAHWTELLLWFVPFLISSEFWKIDGMQQYLRRRQVADRMNHTVVDVRLHSSEAGGRGRTQIPSTSLQVDLSFLAEQTCTQLVLLRCVAFSIVCVSVRERIDAADETRMRRDWRFVE
jgi:hypothetical protein